MQIAAPNGVNERRRWDCACGLSSHAANIQLGRGASGCRNSQNTDHQREGAMQLSWGSMEAGKVRRTSKGPHYSTTPDQARPHHS